MRKSLFDIHRNKQKNKIGNYYLARLYQGQAFYTRWLNFFIYRALVLAGAFLIFIIYSRGNRIFISLLASISALLLYHFVAQKVEKRRLANVIQRENAKLAYEEFLKRIKGLDKEGFTAFVAEILVKILDFSELKKTEYLESEGIDLLCKYKGELTLIQCHLLDGEETVESRHARELSRAMSKRKYRQGIIISTTDFRTDTKIFCDLIKEKRQIKLWNEKILIKIAKEAGKFPKDEEIKDLILKRMEHQERNWHETQKKILGETRIIPYFLYGTVLIILSNFIYPNFKYLYYLGSFMLFILGIIGLIASLNVRRKYPDISR